MAASFAFKGVNVLLVWKKELTVCIISLYRFLGRAGLAVALVSFGAVFDEV